MIYVDAESAAEVELGTLQHPYKSADAPFKEILNEFQGSSTPITVLFKENTISYITSKLVTLNMASLVVT